MSQMRKLRPRELSLAQAFTPGSERAGVSPWLHAQASLGAGLPTLSSYEVTTFTFCNQSHWHLGA